MQEAQNNLNMSVMETIGKKSKLDFVHSYGDYTIKPNKLKSRELSFEKDKVFSN